MLNNALIARQVRLDLAQDLSSIGDVTACLLPSEKMGCGCVVTREPMVVCGRPWVDAVFAEVDLNLQVAWSVEEGEYVRENTVLFEVTGLASAIVKAERSALNWLQTLSGTATITRDYVAQLKGTQAELRDTRKTLPMLREAQKYAVKLGGAENHRMGLYDAFLIKENHILAKGSIEAAVVAARELYPHKTCEVEVESLAELAQAINANPDMILLDNFDLALLKQAVSLNDSNILLEASGNIQFDTLAAVAKTGVDYIAVGSITKNVSAVDLSLSLHLIDA